MVHLKANTPNSFLQTLFEKPLNQHLTQDPIRYILERSPWALNGIAVMVKSLRINPLVKKILIWWNRLFFRAGAFSFAEKLKGAENVLICLPGKTENFASAKDHLTTFSDVFQNKKIFLFLPLAGAENFLSHLKRYVVICPRKEDFGILSLPRRKFIRRIKGYRFEIALDLDLEDGFLNSYLCLKSGAGVRIGLEGKTGPPFYNLQLALSRGRLYQEDIYVGMSETLKNLSLASAAGTKQDSNSTSKM
jgi:hypothetical protein